MEIISRPEAVAKGLKEYFTGKPCGRGHISSRILNRDCKECRKKYQKEYDQRLEIKAYIKDYIHRPEVK